MRQDFLGDQQADPTGSIYELLSKAACDGCGPGLPSSTTNEAIVSHSASRSFTNVNARKSAVSGPTRARGVALALVNSAGCVLRRRDSGNGDNLFCAADVLRSQRRSTQRSATAPTNNSTACRIALCI